MLVTIHRLDPRDNNQCAIELEFKEITGAKKVTRFMLSAIEAGELIEFVAHATEAMRPGEQASFTLSMH